MLYLNCFLVLGLSISTCPPDKYYNECEAILRDGLMAGENWTLFSDNFSGKEAFMSKPAFQRTAKISAIPVLKFNAIEYFRDSTMSVEKYYYQDTTRLIGIVSKANKATKAVSMRMQTGGTTTVRNRSYYMSSGEFSINNLYYYYKLYYRCMFYDASLHRFCVFKENTIMIFDNNTNKFCDAQEYYKISNISGIKTLLSKMQQE